MRAGICVSTLSATSRTTALALRPRNGAAAMNGVMRRTLLALALLAAGCGDARDPPRATSTPAHTRAEAAATAAPVKTAAPRLRDAGRCGGATCFTLRVPLDRANPGGGSVSLPVAVSGPPGAPVFVVLSGGPGEAGLF